MRRTTRSYCVTLLGGLLGSLLLAGCASTPNYPVDASARHSDDRSSEAAAEPEQMRASNEKNNDWSDAFTAPLEDFNLRRQDVPAILEQAVVKPYDLTGLDTCEAIAAEVVKLDTLLGPDYDEPPPPKEARTMGEKSSEFANEQAVGAVRGATRSIIPFRGAVRYFSGADRHQKALDRAIQAGMVRRAYLKGIGMNLNCPPPAAPSWFRPRIVVEAHVDNPPETGRSTRPKQRTSQKRR